MILTAERDPSDPFAFHFMAEVVAQNLCSGITFEFGDNSVMSVTPSCAFLDLSANHRMSWVYETDHWYLQPGTYEARAGRGASSTLFITVP